MSHKAWPILGQGGGGQSFLLRIGWGFYGKFGRTDGRTKLSNGAVSPLKNVRKNIIYSKLAAHFHDFQKIADLSLDLSLQSSYRATRWRDMSL